MANYSILVDVSLQTKQLEQQLKEVSKGAKIDLDDSNIKNATQAVEDFGLTFQEANLIMQRSLDIISAMVDEVYALDASLTEFKKVSELDGSSLDVYQKKLAEIGKTVARTGKPKRQARNVGMVNQH